MIEKTPMGLQGQVVSPIEQHRQFQRVGKAMGALGRVGARYDFPDSLPLVGGRPVLMVGNHRSLFDLVATMAIFTRFDVSSHILIRAAYVNSGPHGKLLRSIGCIALSSEHREDAEETAIRYLQEGKVVSVMPEGRLIAPEDWVDGVGPGKVGASRIAVGAGAVVMPVGFSGTEKVWPRGSLPKLHVPRPVVRLRIGPPLELPGEDHVANTELIMDAIRAVVNAPA